MTKKNRMFPFVTKTWSPIAGGFSEEDGKIYACPYRCSYCWANILINKFPEGNLGKKYSGPYRIHERAMKEWIKALETVFVQCMSDIGAPGIPPGVVYRILNEIEVKSDVTFLLLTKSDKFYGEYMHEIPANCICGITMETDQLIPYEISRAPDPLKRLDGLLELKRYHPHLKTFICIEPIMNFSKDFADKIRKAEPWAVAVGYDNYNSALPEPTLFKTKDLISELEKFTIVYTKTLRDSKLNTTQEENE